MQTELAYLLNELDNWDIDKPITVQDLKKMINRSFEKAEKDDELRDAEQEHF